MEKTNISARHFTLFPPHDSSRNFYRLKKGAPSGVCWTISISRLCCQSRYMFFKFPKGLPSSELSFSISHALKRLTVGPGQ